MADLLAVIPEAHQQNVWVVLGATYQSLFVIGDLEVAEARVDEVAPTNDTERLTLAAAKGMICQLRIHFDRAGDAEYAHVTLAHGKQFVKGHGNWTRNWRSPPR